MHRAQTLRSWRTPRGWTVRVLAQLICAAVLFAGGGSPAHAVRYASDSSKPQLSAALGGFKKLWRSSGKRDLRGSVKDVATLQWNDRVTSWINQNATEQQRFRALQDAQYLLPKGRGYDQSITMADGLGQSLGALYVKGRLTGKLPLTGKLLNNSTGTVGNYLSTGKQKAAFSYPRPFLRAGSKEPATPGDAAECSPKRTHAASLAGIRTGQPWADSKGNLLITRVASATDTTGRLAAYPVELSVHYGLPELCRSGAFPSGHATDAYSSGLMLATLLPELAPSILARTSEAANNRIVLGVHYPLDVIGGRINGHAGVTARWADRKFREAAIVPARKELVGYLESACGAKLASCIAADIPYRNTPYANAAVPGGSAQVVTGRPSALAVYTERLSYGFRPAGDPGKASVPKQAEQLLRTAFPKLSTKQRRSVLAQTQTRSGNPLDTSAAHAKGAARTKTSVPGSWQRLNLAAALSATVRLSQSGTVTVVSVGGQPRVVKAGASGVARRTQPTPMVR